MLLLHQETPPLLLLAVPIPLDLWLLPTSRSSSRNSTEGQREFVVSSTARASAMGSGKQNGGVRSQAQVTQRKVGKVKK
jgi:hypothetical protein